MARTLRDSLAEAWRLGHLAEWGESITYCPASGERRAILALVQRDAAQQLRGPSRAHPPRLVLTVANHATEGIEVGELDPAVDQVELALDAGGTVALRSLGRVLFSDQARLRFEVR